MGIDRINKIKNHRIFGGFAWPQDLLDFKDKNLFYGWNGTGKSTLSNLFRSIEKQAPMSEGQVEFVIDGNKVDGKEKLYFVVETKSTLFTDALRPTEQAKIDCGKQHFKALGNDIEFAVTNSFDDFSGKYV
jgi:predicted ATPase